MQDSHMKNILQAVRIERACRSIESRDPAPSLSELAREAGLSPAHFQRVFVAAVGVSPKAYGVAHRQRRLRNALRKSTRVTDAIYDAGYSANSVAYRDSQVLGMAPGNFNKGGANETIQYCVTRSSLGSLLVGITPRGVCAVEFTAVNAARDSLKQRFPNAQLEKADAHKMKWVKDVVACVDNPLAAVELPLDIRGTAFQIRVWRELRRIAGGSTETYAGVARRIGSPSSTRAVARACATNELSVVIPCHRVVGSSGKLTGYRWGLDRKRKLLKREGLTVINDVVTRPAPQTR
jgi:AraC family transcriptional regulator of adaptative response/methylated-DNA-[protein]-cysteine methyltransferase